MTFLSNTLKSVFISFTVNIKLYWLGVGLLFLLGSCSELQETKDFEGPYYDVKGLIDNEIMLLDSLKPSVNKTVIKDGVSEEKVLDSIEWKNELSSFLEADINKPAWADSYEIKEENAEGLLVTSYVTDLKDLPIRSLKVKTDTRTNDCVSITAVRQVSNYLYSSETELNYLPNVGYKIKGKLNVNMVFSSEYEVEGKFLETYR